MPAIVYVSTLTSSCKAVGLPAGCGITAGCGVDILGVMWGRDDGNRGCETINNPTGTGIRGPGTRGLLIATAVSHCISLEHPDPRAQVREYSYRYGIFGYRHPNIPILGLPVLACPFSLDI